MSQDNPSDPITTSNAPTEEPIRPTPKLYHFPRSRLAIPLKIKGPSKDMELNYQLEHNHRRSRWEYMIQSAQVTFKHNTTCRKCKLPLGEGKHELSEGCTEMKDFLLEDMVDMDLGRTPRQAELDGWRDQWLDLEDVFWDDCGDVECC